MEQEVIQNIIDGQVQEKFGVEQFIHSIVHSNECSECGEESSIKLLEGILKGI
ncbi:hypothetical protein JMF89_16790, partial [Clostridiaceae bacterium UIB06]|nr:hypothetical protein [Clostridiaceae bacterium UIB06]